MAAQARNIFYVFSTFNPAGGTVKTVPWGHIDPILKKPEKTQFITIFFL
jgi:hypothetical protein